MFNLLQCLNICQHNVLVYHARYTYWPFNLWNTFILWGMCSTSFNLGNTQFIQRDVFNLRKVKIFKQAPFVTHLKTLQLHMTNFTNFNQVFFVFSKISTITQISSNYHSTITNYHSENEKEKKLDFNKQNSHSCGHSWTIQSQNLTSC